LNNQKTLQIVRLFNSKYIKSKKYINLNLLFFGIFLILFSLSSYAVEIDTEAQTYSKFSKDELKMFGVITPPKDAFLQDSYKGIKFIATPKRVYTKEQLELLKYFIDRTPDTLLKYAPSAIVNAEVGFIPALAKASGPYIYFDSKSFNTSGFWSANSIEGVFRVFIHELVHVLQFRETIKTIDIESARKRFKKYKRQTLWTFALMKTELINSFAKVTGWKLKKGSIVIAKLKDFKHEKTSKYGRVSIREDMPETVSFVVIGDTSPLSQQRVHWAIDLLGYSSLTKVFEYTFPYNEKLKKSKIIGLPKIAELDKNKQEAFKKRYLFSDIEHFISKLGYDEVVQILNRGFKKRKWKKIISKNIVLKNNIKKSLMEYQGKWRDVYIEVISFEDAAGYLSKPDDTIITVLSGYHK